LYIICTTIGEGFPTYLLRTSPIWALELKCKATDAKKSICEEDFEDCKVLIYASEQHLSILHSPWNLIQIEFFCVHGFAFWLGQLDRPR